MIFDPANKRIILSTATVSASEIWSRWVDWVAQNDNGKYLPALSQVGGDDLGSSLAIPIYIFLLNGWRVRPMEENHQLTITGNLFVDGGGVPLVNTLGNYNVIAQYTVPVQAQTVQLSGSGSISDSQIATIGNAVWSHAVEAGYSAEEILKLVGAVLVGKVIGAGSGTESFIGLDDETTRIVAVVDGSGNRTGINRNPT